MIEYDRLRIYLKGMVVFALLLFVAGSLFAAEQEAVIVGNKTCPVSGEKIEEGSVVTYEYRGKVYSFCCQGCVEEFKKDPDRYIEKMEKSEGDKGGDKQHHHHH